MESLFYPLCLRLMYKSSLFQKCLNILRHIGKLLLISFHTKRCRKKHIIVLVLNVRKQGSSRQNLEKKKQNLVNLDQKDACSTFFQRKRGFLHLTGVDYSDLAVTLASSVARSEGFEDIEFMVMYCLSYSFLLTHCIKSHELQAVKFPHLHLNSKNHRYYYSLSFLPLCEFENLQFCRFFILPNFC